MAGCNFSFEPCHDSVDCCVCNHESTHIHLFTSLPRSVDLLPPVLLEWAVGRSTTFCSGWCASRDSGYSTGYPWSRSYLQRRAWPAPTVLDNVLSLRCDLSRQFQWSG